MRTRGSDAEPKWALAELAKRAERLAGRAREFSERYGQDETEAPIGGKT